jgi:hypothetical protein
VLSRRLVVHASLSLALLLTVSAACSAAARPPAPARRVTPVTLGAEPRVVVIGESLVQQVAGLEIDQLRAHGFSPEIRSRNSETVTSTFVQDAVRQAAASRAPIVVLETASNDAYQSQPMAAKIGWPAVADLYRYQLADTLAVLAHQCVVLVDTRDSTTAAWYHLAQAGPPINASIRAAAQSDPNPVVVVPWSNISRSHEADWFWADGLHFGDPSHDDRDWHSAGATAFAQAMANGVRDCATRLSPH